MNTITILSVQGGNSALPMRLRRNWAHGVPIEPPGDDGTLNAPAITLKLPEKKLFGLSAPVP